MQNTKKRKDFSILKSIIHFNLVNTQIEYPSNFNESGNKIFKIFWMGDYNTLSVQLLIYKSSFLIPSILGEFKNFNVLNFTHLNLFLIIK